MLKQKSSILVVLAFLAFISLGLPDAVLGVAWPSIRQTFGISLSRLGELLATLMAGYLLSSAVSGTVVRRIGVGRVLFYSSVLVVLSLAGYALAPAWWVMVAVGVLAGLGAGAIDAGLNAYAAAELPPRLVTWLHACYGIGATLGPATMTAVLSADRPWRWGYAIIGGVLSLMAVLFLATQKLWTLHPSESAEASPNAAPGGATAPGDTSALDATAMQTLRLPLAWAQIALFFLYTGLEVAAGQWLYSLLTESRGVDPTLAGTCVSLYWGGLTGGRFVFGIIAGSLRPQTILRAGMAVAPVAILFITFSKAPMVTLGAAILLGFVLAPIFPLLISVTPDRLGRRYAVHAVGFQVSAAYLGGAALPGAVGILAKSRGLEILGPFLLCASVALVALHELAIRMTPKQERAAASA